MSVSRPGSPIWLGNPDIPPQRDGFYVIKGVGGVYIPKLLLVLGKELKGFTGKVLRKALGLDSLQKHCRSGLS
ncbi:hypothetical protein KFL_001020115 [Klebsormidium nitens]|uniref:Uncharacterized protein n=1 Tax=Klebsormidium nitens TaxID=105231 RepID=A0A1Y1HYZ5_KLENI|nr:hypothetical protein KFL_001020115 [Klebsormidium nitens]|eukprot:GAQ82161.1 hypothetical protein KFL_001020115 [Klebsormidium nitens]